MTVFKELTIGDKGLTREGEIVTITSINKARRFPLGYFSDKHKQYSYVNFLGRYEYYEWLETPKNSPHDLIRGLKLEHWNKIKDTK